MDPLAVIRSPVPSPWMRNVVVRCAMRDCLPRVAMPWIVCPLAYSVLRNDWPRIRALCFRCFSLRLLTGNCIGSLSLCYWTPL